MCVCVCVYVYNEHFFQFSKALQIDSPLSRQTDRRR